MTHETNSDDRSLAAGLRTTLVLSQWICILEIDDASGERKKSGGTQPPGLLGIGGGSIGQRRGNQGA